ncbi:hypothetical protein JYU34_007880 [Plutella xylostella]|uniref:Uncharacterized protein n=1 Tax=Plutella xylostella TaxID=51655 RepID=A0ABQ7QRJ5_PLUXY|nr:hypothetical protein JYU34_007880 [Plutella xylostella]
MKVVTECCHTRASRSGSSDRLNDSARPLAPADRTPEKPERGSLRSERRGHCRVAVARTNHEGPRTCEAADWSRGSPAPPPPAHPEFEDPNLAALGGQGRARARRRERGARARAGRRDTRLRHTTKIFLVMEQE